MSNYRDPTAGLREQIAQRRAFVDELQESFSQLFWAMLSDTVRAQLATLERRVDACEDDDLSSTMNALDALVHRLEAIFASADDVLECDDHVAPPTAPGVFHRGAPNRALATGFAERARAHVLEMTDDGEVEVEPWCGTDRVDRVFGDDVFTGRIFRFKARGVPFLLAGNAAAHPGYDRHAGSEALILLRTTVPRAIVLSVRAEGLGHKLAEVLTRKRDVKIGDKEFDSKFIIEGNTAVATALLLRKARQAFITLDAPQLTIDNGVAELQYTAKYSQHSVATILSTQALDVLETIRDTALHAAKRRQ